MADTCRFVKDKITTGLENELDLNAEVRHLYSLKKD